MVNVLTAKIIVIMEVFLLQGIKGVCLKQKYLTFEVYIPEEIGHAS